MTGGDALRRVAGGGWRVETQRRSRSRLTTGACSPFFQSSDDQQLRAASPSHPPPATRHPPRLAALTAALVTFCLLFSLLPAQPLTPVIPGSADSLRAVLAPPRKTTVPADTAKPALADSAAGAVARADTAKVVMHHFNHRQQIITGGSIMAALIAITVVMNNYNPRVTTF